MYEGVATTSSSEDELGRVKVECKNLWETESTLLPVLNNIYISKGDRVILFSPENLQQSLFVLGKFQSKANQANDAVDSKNKATLFQARVEDTFIMGTQDEKSIHVETDKGFKFDLTSDTVSIEVPEGYTLKAKTQSVEVEEGYTFKSKTREETMSDSNKCTAKTQEFKASGGSFKIESQKGQELFSILSDLLNALDPKTNPISTMGSPSAQVFHPTIATAIGAAKEFINTFK